MKYYIIAVFVIWLVLGTGLAAAGTLTVSLDPSLDGNGTIKATSITKAELLNVNVNVSSSAPAAIGTVLSDNTVKFNLSGIASGDYFIRLNDLSDNLVPTRIDDPRKDINQFVGRTLSVSIIGNLSDPIYRIETFTKGKASLCYDGFPIVWFNAYLILSLKTNPQRFDVNGFFIGAGLGLYDIGMIRITDFTPTIPTHPSTSTSTNSPFSKWVFSHGDDYGGNDSKCSGCHGNLSTKSASVSAITVNNGFCFRCHNGKGGAENGWLWQQDVCPYHPHMAPPELWPTLTATPTAIPTPTPKIPAFEAIPAIATLLIVLRLVKNKL